MASAESTGNRCWPHVTWLGILLLLLLGASPARAATSLTIEPAQLVVALAPGDTAEQYLKITNESSAAIQLATVLEDYRADDQGSQLTFHSAGTEPDSLQGLVSVSPERFELTAGATQVIRLHFTAPAVDRATKYKGVVRVSTAQVGVSDAGVSVTADVGTLVGLTVSPPPAQRPDMLLGSMLALSLLVGGTWLVRARRSHATK